MDEKAFVIFLRLQASATSRRWRISSRAGPHARLLESRPDIGAAVAACSTNKLRLKIGQAHMIRPALSVDERVSAPVIAAMDEQPARAVIPESDFLLALHGAIKARQALHQQRVTDCGARPLSPWGGDGA